MEVCLSQAQALNDISALVDCRLMAVFFWMGWEGAVMQAKLARNGEPLDIFITIFINELIKNKA
ncbi:TetR family transcriptional regulator C-terminal domain-containing protein [Morganella psychrotolerans]|uniref:TetR family transcriptional regulator C-terminal domain-containing protein n=1 Tax=Morganella psychrotolerans TaxID=368603 RepID=UPI002688F31F